MRDLKKEAQKFAPQLQGIKVCAFDVDGILTDGRIEWLGKEVGWNRSTHVRDGHGMKILMTYGLKVGIISAGNSDFLLKRFKENLALDFFFCGHEDKRYAFKKLWEEGYTSSQILYMGDELFDIPLLKKAGFSATCPEAGHEVQEVVDYITERPAGMGCAREVMDMLRYAQGLQLNIPDFEDDNNDE